MTAIVEGKKKYIYILLKNIYLSTVYVLLPLKCHFYNNVYEYD